jgi:hypothetical protein
MVKSFITLDTVIMIVTYNRKTFKVQATGNTKGGSITLPLTSCLTGLKSAI